MSYKSHNVISCGGHHVAVVTQEGKVVCWGDNADHQCDVPAELESEQVVSVSCGAFHTAVLTAEGKVVCWGYDDDGQCSCPSELVSAVACGLLHTCALMQDWLMLWPSVVGTLTVQPLRRKAALFAGATTSMNSATYLIACQTQLPCAAGGIILLL
jgi:hypothetical protein